MCIRDSHNPSAASCTITQAEVQEGTVRTLALEYRAVRANLDAASDAYYGGTSASTNHQWQSLSTVNIE